ncbi:unnamed protein product [Prunus armeniaca]
MEKMFLIVRGVVAVTNEYWTQYRSEAYNVQTIAISEVEVLVLMANDLARVQPRRIHSKTFLLRNRSLQVGLN